MFNFGPGFGAFEDEGPTMDDLAMDDSLSALDKFQRYVNSEIVLQRLFMLKEIADLVTAIGYADTVAHVLPALEDLMSDHEAVIRQTLAEKLAVLGSVMMRLGGDDGYTRVVTTLVPLVGELTTDHTLQVRAAAGTGLVELAKLLTEGDLETRVVPLVAQLAADEDEEESRVESCAILDNLSGVCPMHVVTTTIIPLVDELSQDPMFRVRKACASNLETMCARVTGTRTADADADVGARARADNDGDGEADDAAVTQMLAIYDRLSGDDIWGVRKACAESLPRVARHIRGEPHTPRLVARFESFVEDVSRWVRNAAFKALGPFIATFGPVVPEGDTETLSAELLGAGGAEVPAVLIRYYNDMTNPALSKSIDSEITMHCAFNFPAVMLTLGAGRWEDVAATYSALVGDMQWTVRKTLAFSLHLIAQILGTEATEAHLVPVFDTFLHDLDEVRVGVLRSFAVFLGVLSPTTRLEFLPILESLMMSADNWRFRELIARQLIDLAALFPTEVLVSRIVPLVFNLCDDSVAYVRAEANTAVGPVLARLIQDEADNPDLDADADTTGPNSADVITRVLNMAQGASYQTRQMFIRCCRDILDHVDKTVFAAHFVPTLEGMVEDPVPNVRLLLASMFNHMSHSLTYAGDPAVTRVLAALATDKDVDVAHAATVDPDRDPSLVLEQPHPPSRRPQPHERLAHTPIETTIETGSGSDTDTSDAADAAADAADAADAPETPVANAHAQPPQDT